MKMAAAFGRPDNREESIITTRSGASALWPPFEDYTGPLRLRAQRSNVGHYYSPEESSINPILVYEQPFSRVGYGAMEELTWSVPSSSLVSSLYPWDSANETDFPLSLLEGSGSGQQTDGEWEPAIQPDQIAISHQPHYQDSTIDGAFETQQRMHMPDLTDLVHGTDICFVSPSPLPDGALSHGNEDPWSLPGCHPTSPQFLVIHTRPSHEGYDNTLCLEDFGANFRSFVQQPGIIPWFGYEDDHVAYQYPKGWSTCHERQPIPAILIRDPVHATFSSEETLHPDPQANVQPPTVETRVIPQETQFCWDSKTGSQLNSTRTKRRPSDEERASTQMIIRQGGSCDACRRGHRKVLFSNATIPSPY
jgi:hypothetical protein